MLSFSNQASSKALYPSMDGGDKKNFSMIQQRKRKVFVVLIGVITLTTIMMGLWRFFQLPNPVLFVMLEPYRDLRAIPAPLGAEMESLGYPMSGWVLSYDSSARIEQILEFYQAELPKQGWTIREQYAQGYRKCILAQQDSNLRVIEIDHQTHIRFVGGRLLCTFDSVE